MPRRPRIHLDGSVHYVTVTALRAGLIFKDAADYQTYLTALFKYRDQYGFKLFSYCLLADRVHLLIETGKSGSISEVMRDLNTAYTKSFNSKYGRRGPLFESRFRSALVEKSEYLPKMSRFVHQASKDAAHPYSSLPFYIGEPGRLREEVAEVASFFADGVEEYRRYCAQADPVHAAEIRSRLKQGGVIGSEAFAEQVRDTIRQQAQEKKEIVPASRLVNARRLAMVFGGLVLAAVSLSVYLYGRQADAQAKYRELMAEKEQAYFERSRFENRSPLAPTEMDGTVWRIELLSPSGETLRDTLRFQGGRFHSDYLKSRGFVSSNYFLVPLGGGRTRWQSPQSSSSGDTAGWNGQWTGDSMKGTMNLSLKGRSPQEYSFYSVKWDYAGGAR